MTRHTGMLCQVVWRGNANTVAVGAALAVELIAISAGAQAAWGEAPVLPTWNETALYDFDGNGSDGALPWAGLIRDSRGNMYGTTQGGDAGFGNVFKVDKNGNVSSLYAFADVAKGDQPFSDLVLDSHGNLYGTTAAGGNYGYGVVFRLDTSGNESVLYSFTGGADGGGPMAGLVRDPSGNLYGTTSQGGNKGCSYGCGVVFRLDTSGNETVLHTFTGGKDGASPQSDLILDKRGNLFGVAGYGGDVSKCFDTEGKGCGVVFKLNVNKNWREKVLYTFENGADGATPQGRLVRDRNGNLYGTTADGGTGYGVVFKLDTRGGETPLYSFTNGTDGATPKAGVVMDKNGNLYGTTQAGGYTGNNECGSYGCGVVFEVDSSGSETVLYAFTGQTDGGGATAPLLLDTSGVLYGTTEIYGDNSCYDFGCGVVFKVQNN